MKNPVREQPFAGVKKYGTFFGIRFSAGLQYRTAALAGIATQFAWGFLNILLYRAFWLADPDAFPMGMGQVASYIWLRQAFLALFNAWTMDNTILSDITGGGVAYELIRPMDLYTMWFTKNLSSRLSNAALRCLPVLLVGSLVPAPYGMSLPADPVAFAGFLLTGVLATLVTISLIMFVYILTFFTMQPMGVRMVFNAVTDFCSGALVPLPFFPAALAAFLELTPFASMANVPFRVYSGHIAGWDILRCAGMQVFWLVLAVGTGKLLMKLALRKTVVQGG